MRGRFETIDDYIAAFPPHVRALLDEMRRQIREAAPNTVEAISHGIPTLKPRGGNLVHVGAVANDIGFYPTPPGIAAFDDAGNRRFLIDASEPF
mgnify:CR=1 FL=1